MVALLAFVGGLTAGECDSVHWAQNEEGKYRLENAANEPLTAYRYDRVYAFSHGVANVQIGDLVGMVNVLGKEIARPIYTFAPIRFGEVPIMPSCKGVPRYISCAVNMNLGGAMWLDAEGKVLQTGAKALYRITDKVPDNLWDY